MMELVLVLLLAVCVPKKYGNVLKKPLLKDRACLHPTLIIRENLFHPIFN